MNSERLTFIGGGNMASAIIGGLLDSGVDPSTLRVIDPDLSVRDRLSNSGIPTQADIDPDAMHADMLVLAIKPQIMPEVLVTLAKHWPDGPSPVVLSVVASITFETMIAQLGQQAIIRCMPNTPALVGAGMSALVANAQVTSDQKAQATAILDKVGTCVWLEDEGMLDLVTAVSGSGPAYFFALAEHMVTAAVARGLDPILAKTLVHQTALGAGKMLSQTDVSAQQLRSNVTSPGGTTEAALTVLTQGNLSNLVDQAIEAAWQRAQTLGLNAPKTKNQS